MFRTVVVKATAAMCCHNDDTKANKTAAARMPQMVLVRARLGQGFTSTTLVPSSSACQRGRVARRGIQMTPRAIEIKLQFH